jgi:hypothetical protein
MPLIRVRDARWQVVHLLDLVAATGVVIAAIVDGLNLFVKLDCVLPMPASFL